MKAKFRNITVTLEEQVVQWARLEAARRKTSASRLLGGILRERIERMPEKHGYEAAMRCAAPWRGSPSSRRTANIYRARRRMSAPIFVDASVFPSDPASLSRL
jgi:hypothetical protein